MKKRILICTGTGCASNGSTDLYNMFLEKMKQMSVSDDFDLVKTGCHGFCEKGPLIVIEPEDIFYCNVREEDVQEIIEKTLINDKIVDRLLYEDIKSNTKALTFHDVPFYKKQKRYVLHNCGHIDPESIDEYVDKGGYTALKDVLQNKSREQVIDELKKSGLRGRGGGGFPTGLKWEFIYKEKSEDKYVVCNADEGDPGAFMDRSLLEADPHSIIEGLAICAYAVGAKHSYVYLRAEYPLAIERLSTAIEQASQKGYLGNNILNTKFNFNISIKKGAGAFVCGEETALMHSIEGKRGMPRPRPPFPTTSGLFEKPTVINNVETFANIPLIFKEGYKWFASIGTETSKGTKIFAVTGKVNNTGLVEVPMGTTLREVIFDIAGGIKDNKKFKAVQIGGPSGGCITEENLDIPIDYESLLEVGAMMGSGGLVVMDEDTCMVDVAKFFLDFIQKESCGKCIPCREGTKRMLEILESITRSRKGESENDSLIRFQGIQNLHALSKIIKDTSLCGLGQTAPNPFLSTMRWFKDEYEAHIYDRRCPAGACKELVGVSCQNSCPVGTEAWKYVAEIARGDFESAYRTIREANPFPSVCARVCDHPCESSCRLGSTGGDPIAIRNLKRFIVEQVDPSAYKIEFKLAKEDANKVAVIGAGPSGITAANLLSVKGLKVTIFEKENKPGGMLTSAIPSYRLPREKLEKEIDSLLNENIELKCNMALGKQITVDNLLKDGYKAVYVAIGSHKSYNLGLEGENAKGIIAGLDFLKAYNLEDKVLAKGKVGVVGGGNSAIDAARVALRNKNVDSVTVFYRRTENEMPAYREEIEAAMEEGIEIKTLVTPTKVIQKDGVLKGMEFLKNSLKGKDSSGRPKPVPVEGSEFEVELDTLIVAISEQPDSDVIKDLGCDKWGSLSVNEESLLTEKKGVFGGGDVVTGPSTVIKAVAAGKKAAYMISRYLEGKSLRVPREVVLPEVFVKPLEVDGSEDDVGGRLKAPLLPVAERKHCFKEVELSYCEKDAITEARRCMRCDLEFTQTVNI